MKLIGKVSSTLFCLMMIMANVQCLQYVPLVYMRFPPDVNLELGSGHQPNYLPILECKTGYDPFHVVKCNVYTRDHDRCNFTLYLAEGTVQVVPTTVHQFLMKKLAIVWVETRDEVIDPLQYYTKITTVDMSTCSTSTKILNAAHPGTMVKFYTDTFDVFSAGKQEKNITRTNYDIQGNRKGESVNMFFDSDNFFRIFPASIESPDKGFFIFTLVNGNSKLSFVEPSGKEIKRLVVLDGLKVNKVVSDLDRWMRVICWAGFDKADFIECAKFNQFGDEIWRSRTNSSHGDEPFFVRHMGGGGILLLSRQYNNKLQVIEMQPDSKTLKSTYSASFDLLINNVKVVDVNETDRTFLIFWIKRGAVVIDMSLAKYSFPSKL